MWYAIILVIAVAAVGFAYWRGHRSGTVSAERKALMVSAEEKARADKARDAGIAAFPGVRSDS